MSFFGDDPVRANPGDFLDPETAQKMGRYVRRTRTDPCPNCGAIVSMSWLKEECPSCCDLHEARLSLASVRKASMLKLRVLNAAEEAARAQAEDRVIFRWSACPQCAGPKLTSTVLGDDGKERPYVREEALCYICVSVRELERQLEQRRRTSGWTGEKGRSVGR